jgi:hypothetical protein
MRSVRTRGEFRAAGVRTRGAGAPLSRRANFSPSITLSLESFVMCKTFVPFFVRIGHDLNVANRNSRVNIWGRESVDEESAWGLSAGMGARGVQPPQQHRAVGRVARRSPDVGATTLTWLGAGVGGFVGPQGGRASGRCSRCS